MPDFYCNMSAIKKGETMNNADDEREKAAIQDAMKRGPFDPRSNYASERIRAAELDGVMPTDDDMKEVNVVARCGSFIIQQELLGEFYRIFGTTPNAAVSGIPGIMNQNDESREYQKAIKQIADQSPKVDPKPVSDPEDKAEPYGSQHPSEKSEDYDPFNPKNWGV